MNVPEKMFLKVQKIDTEKVYENCIFMHPKEFKKGHYLEVQAGRSRSQNFLFAVKKDESIAQGCWLFRVFMYINILFYKIVYTKKYLSCIKWDSLIESWWTLHFSHKQIPINKKVKQIFIIELKETESFNF